MPDHMSGDKTLGDSPTSSDMAKINLEVPNIFHNEESYCITTYGTSYSRGTNDKGFGECESTEVNENKVSVTPLEERWES